MKKKIVLSILLILTILSTNVMITLAATKSELESSKKENEAKIKEKEEKQEEIEEKISEANKQIQTLSSQISQYKSQIAELDIELSDLEDSIEKAEKKLKAAEKKYDEQQEVLQARLVAQYEAGETTYLDVILGGGSLWDMVSNWYIVSEIADKDNELLEKIEKNKKDIEDAKETLETSKKQVEALKTSKEETANALEDSQSQKEKQVSKLNDEDKKLQDEIDKLNAENEQLESELASMQQQYSGEIADLGGDGTLQKPVKGGVITATMYYSSGAYHGAIDYGVPEGTTVYAAADGVVLAAGWRVGGLGYATVIQHANGLRTYYGHGNGNYYVSEGAVVKKGQAIMQSGNTGNSSGPHLHFEVRVSPYDWSYGGGDSRRDPRNYL